MTKNLVKNQIEGTIGRRLTSARISIIRGRFSGPAVTGDNVSKVWSLKPLRIQFRFIGGDFPARPGLNTAVYKSTGFLAACTRRDNKLSASHTGWIFCLTHCAHVLGPDLSRLFCVEKRHRTLSLSGCYLTKPVTATM